MDDPVPNLNLPESVTAFVEGIARRVSRRAAVRDEVRRELLDHFEDALRPYTEEADRARRGRQLIEDFGDGALLTALIRRGKNRCRPPWQRALLASAKAFAALFAVGIVFDVVLSHRNAQRLQDEIGRLRESGAITSMQDLMDRAQESREEAAAAGGGNSAGCPATEIWFTLKPESIDPAGWRKRGTQKDPKAAPPRSFRGIDAETWESWSPEIEADVRATLERTREAVAEARRLADLPPDNFGAIVELVQGDRIAAFRIPSLLGSRMAANLLALDAIVAVKENRPDAALDDATTILKMTRHLLGACPILLGPMIVCAMRNYIALAGIVEPALNETDFSEEAESRFLEALANMDLAKELSTSLEWERLMCLDLAQGAIIPMGAGTDDHMNRAIPVANVAARLLPFWHDAGVMRALKLYNRAVELQALPYPEFARRYPAFETEFANTPEWLSPLAKWTMPNTYRAKIQVTQCQEKEDLARVALALRRFKRTRGAYPDALTSLVPDFLQELPMDRFTGDPLHYRRDGEGCLIYSVSFNGQDDGGAARDVSATADDVAWTLKR